ncbi:hypothetical protein GH714_007690 [Hevea brasiliensis]|uniref:Retrotransposon gag domain-containing protein n=1 Tax=Hevea brasiliensis TaxID=3981 RepID=A0A6A6M080_HEVBR|nr:hypothetical protein GH714_007690 [Hevea brasiliensis]
MVLINFAIFFGELTKLRPHGIVQDYKTQFNKLLAKLGQLSQARQVSYFVTGLIESIRTDVQANCPTTLSHAISLIRLTWDEPNERKKLGLRFKYNEKYGPNHRCKKFFTIQAVLEYSDGDADMEVKNEESTKILAISLHAIFEFEGLETMRLQGKLENQHAMVQVDSESTHNFVTKRFARKAGL